MVIAEILGGLGNQLDAYICGYTVAKYLDQELVLDVSDYTLRGYIHPYCLDNLQIGSHRKLIYPPASSGFMDESCLPEDLRANNLRIIRHEDYKTRETLLAAAEGAENIYLLGYGGPHYCTQEERDKFRERLQPRTPSIAVRQFREKIQREYSVAVHLRRTDFVDLNCHAPVKYYQAAITYIKQIYPDAHFYFFSDDIQYAKSQFGPFENYHFVHLLGGMDANLDEFFCISACNGRILTAQSSYGFWAAELSQSSNQINLCQKTEKNSRDIRNQICLNDEQIDAFSRRYETKLVSQQQISVNDEVLSLIEEARNDEAVALVDQVSLDSYRLSKAETKELALFKTIALAQKGEDGLPAALRTFYVQMQREHEDATFHANYFRALYQSGYIEESAIHAALANRYGDPEDYQEYFAQMVPFGQKLYQLLQTKPVRHFIFFPMEGWNYYTPYVKTLALLLARMGQKVSFFQPMGGTVRDDVSDEMAARYALENIRSVGSVYCFHVDLIPCLSKGSKGKENYKTLFHELVSQCVDRFPLPAVAVVSHPDVFLEQKVSGIPYVVPDIFDPLNREKFLLSSNIETYITYMAEHADTIFLSGAALPAARKIWGSKIHPAFPAWEGPSHRILDMELDFTYNYISLPQMIQNAAALLEV